MMITFNIESEDSSDHWSYFDVENEVVLDLGCGRWCNRWGGENINKNEFSSVYLGLKKSVKVIGVDSSVNEIEYFSEEFKDNPKFEFIHKEIKTQED